MGTHLSEEEVQALRSALVPRAGQSYGKIKGNILPELSHPQIFPMQNHPRGHPVSVLLQPSILVRCASQDTVGDQGGVAGGGSSSWAHGALVFKGEQP